LSIERWALDRRALLTAFVIVFAGHTFFSRWIQISIGPGRHIIDVSPALIARLCRRLGTLLPHRLQSDVQ
jgi:hypothetical protein